MSKNPNKVIIPCRFSYLHCWEPDSVNGSEPKYSVSAIIPKSDTAIGVVATLASHIDPSLLPLAITTEAAIVAEIATYLGGPTAFLDTEKRHLWASFGMYLG